jgi:hypothetical protein
MPGNDRRLGAAASETPVFEGVDIALSLAFSRPYLL